MPCPASCARWRSITAASPIRGWTATRSPWRTSPRRCSSTAQFSHAYFSRGTLLRDGGQYLFALADFDKALRFDYPDPARVYVAQSITYEKLQRTDDARDALKKALAANPGYEPALKRLAVLDGVPQATAADGWRQHADGGGDARQRHAARRHRTRSPPDGRRIAAGGCRAGVGQAHHRPRAAGSPRGERGGHRSAQLGQAQEKILAVEDVPEDQAAPQAEQTEAPSLPQRQKPLRPQPAESESEPAAEAPVTGWAVQIASASTEDAARATWNKMKARNKALASKTPVMVRADLGAKGVFYRVRLVGLRFSVGCRPRVLEAQVPRGEMLRQQGCILMR